MRAGRKRRRMLQRTAAGGLPVTAKKMTRQTNLIHLAGTLQVSKLIKRERGTDFEKDIRETLLTRLVVFVNRYLFCGRF